MASPPSGVSGETIPELGFLEEAPALVLFRDGDCSSHFSQSPENSSRALAPALIPEGAAPLPLGVEYNDDYRTQATISQIGRSYDEDQESVLIRGGASFLGVL